MPINLAQIAADRATIQVEFGGETSKITIRPSIVTPARISAARASAQDGGDDLADTVGFLVEVIESWDVVDGDQPVPVSAEVISQMRLDLVQALTKAIISYVGEVFAEGEGGPSGV